MATYQLKWYFKGWRHYPNEIEGMDEARATVCAIIQFLKEKKGLRAVQIYIHDVTKPSWDYGEVWMKGDTYLYNADSKGSDKGIIWTVNPNTGKTVKKYGYVE